MSNFNDNILRRYNPFLILWSCVLIRTVISCQEINVKTCPNTPQNWQKAELAKNCSSNGCSEDEVYHCVQTETKGQLVEVCTPAIFLQGVCPYYDTVGKSLQMGSISCLDNASQNCSTRYFSTSVYKYNVCFPSMEQVSFANSWIHSIKNKSRTIASLFFVMFLHFYS